MPDFRFAQVVVQTEPLAEDFPPARLPSRSGHVRGLLESLAAPEGGRGVPAWLHGPPGSGKTLAAKTVLAALEERGVGTAYVNCWAAQTFYGVLEATFRELRALVGDQRDVTFKLERLVRLARERRLVIALDEVDQMLPRERNATFYNLAGLNGAGLVCLSQSREAWLALDPRVQSRVQPRFLEFPPYTREELVAILQDRASQALAPAAWCRSDLERIAQASAGDARIAIQALRVAAYLAEKRRVPQIQLGDLEEGMRQASELRRRYLLKGMSEHHRLLYQLVQERPGIELRQLWRGYLTRAREGGREPMARRTFNHYKLQLVSSRLLEERQARGRSNQRMLRVVA